MAGPSHRPGGPTRDGAPGGGPGREALVVVAGIPGAGKSTVLRRLRAADLLGGARVIDTDASRGWLQARLRHVPYPALRPLVHVAHWARVVVLAFTEPRPLLIHDTATRSVSRSVLLRLARLARRPARMVWIDTDPPVARQGQFARGRILGRAAFERHVRRTRRHDPAQVARARWDLVRRTDRQGAAEAILAAAGTAPDRPPRTGRP